MIDPYYVLTGFFLVLCLILRFAPPPVSMVIFGAVLSALAVRGVVGLRRSLRDGYVTIPPRRNWLLRPWLQDDTDVERDKQPIRYWSRVCGSLIVILGFAVLGLYFILAGIQRAWG